MLTEIKIEDIQLFDILYFKWDRESQPTGPYIVIGWNRNFNSDNTVTFLRDKPDKPTNVTTIDMSGTSMQDCDKFSKFRLSHFTPRNQPGLTFYKSDAIFFQETL